MRRALVFLLACQPPTSPTVVAPAASVEAAPERGDSCQTDIPDCEAACALRETHRTGHIDWFDRRCAAVVLGKNPDKAVAGGSDASVVDALACDPPFSLGANGVKTWKRDCFP